MQTSGGSAARFYPVRSRLVRTLPPELQHEFLLRSVLLRRSGVPFRGQ